MYLCNMTRMLNIHYSYIKRKISLFPTRPTLNDHHSKNKNGISGELQILTNLPEHNSHTSIGIN